MARLYLAANYVKSSDPTDILPVPADLENSGHLHLVFEDDNGNFQEIEV